MRGEVGGGGEGRGGEGWGRNLFIAQQQHTRTDADVPKSLMDWEPHERLNFTFLLFLINCFHIKKQSLSGRHLFKLPIHRLFLVSR